MAINNKAWIMGAVGLLISVSFGIYASQVDTAAMPPAALAAAFTGLGFMLIWFWLDRRAIAQFLAARSTRQSGVGTVLVGVALALALGVNAVATKHDIRWDLTSSQRYKISPQTVAVLNALTQPIEARVFFVGDSVEK